LSQGTKLVTIERETGIVRQQLYHLVNQALSVHPDGRMFGFRALLPYTRVKNHERQKVIASKMGQGQGYSGAMNQLLERYPELFIWLKGELGRHPLLFSPLPNGKLKVNGLHAIHRGFLEQCRKLGLRESDYPLMRDQQGIRTLSLVIKRLGAKSFGQAARATGAARSKHPWNERADAPVQAVTRPFQAVEFDGHKLDLRLCITYPDPFGFEQTVELNRIWILVIADIFTRVTLGYQLVLSPEYHRYDVIRTIQKALLPHAPMAFTIPGLGYGVGGFPSQRMPELAYVVWDEFRLDNAKANLANDTLQVLYQELG